jgi:diguanylate cyclase (GGDEF)-like protein/PAS domain S-box-containing protein
MSDFQNKTFKKPVSFKKPGGTDRKKYYKENDIIRAKKKSFLSQIKDFQEEIELLTSYSTDTIYRLDYRSMKYNYISPAVSRLLGFTPQEMKRINFRSLIVETKLVTDGLVKISSFDELEDKRIKGDVGKWNADYLIRTKSGGKIWVSDISLPWFDERGHVIGSIGSLRDITERVQIEQRMFSDIQSISTQDPLTQLPGKTNFFSAVDRELRRIKRSNEEISLVLIDIDDLAEISKTASAEMTNQLIISISKMISEALRETDFVARIDGGTFAMLLPETGVKGAYFVADRIRASVNSRQFTFGGDRKAFNCSISAGIATADAKDNLSCADIYKLADTRLFIARNTGRNQVSIDEIVAVH